MSEYYHLEKSIPRPKGEFRLASAAMMICMLCSTVIDGMGGPGEYICIECGDDLKAGRLRGCMVREQSK